MSAKARIHAPTTIAALGGFFPPKKEVNMENRRKAEWHLEKSISVGHIMTTLTVAASVMIWALHMDTRVSLLEAAITVGQQNDTRIEREIKAGLDRFEATLIRIENKLDGKQDKSK